MSASFQIELTDLARVKLRKQDPQIRDRIVRKLDQATTNPSQYLERLSSIESHKLRVGDYRVIVDVDWNRQILYVLTLGHRSEIYASARVVIEPSARGAAPRLGREKQPREGKTGKFRAPWGRSPAVARLGTRPAGLLRGVRARGHPAPGSHAGRPEAASRRHAQRALPPLGRDPRGGEGSSYKRNRRGHPLGSRARRVSPGRSFTRLTIKSNISKI
jgi:mRNA interferase RelE/StbE